MQLTAVYAYMCVCVNMRIHDVCLYIHMLYIDILPMDGAWRQ